MFGLSTFSAPEQSCNSIKKNQQKISSTDVDCIMIFANRTDDFQAACSLDPDQTAPMSDLGPNYLQS